MRFSHVSIASVAAVEAPHRVASSELEERLAPLFRRLSMPAGVIASLSGINARRFWDDFSPPHMGFKKGPDDTHNWNSETFALAAAAERAAPRAADAGLERRR